MSPQKSDEEFDGAEARLQLERRLVRKIDLRMSILVLIYILNYIDRSNVASARLKGFEADLHLKGQEYATVLAILYVGYTIMQIPSNMFLNWVERPSLYLPIVTMIWGVVSITTGLTKNFVGVVIARFFLGFSEAAFFPGVVFLLSKWYKRDEMGLRTAILFSGFIVSNAFGALIASGILTKMDNKGGVAAWRWLFYIEGGVTIAVAFLAMFILPDFPHNTRSFSPQERALAMLRMREDANMEDEQDERVTALTAFCLTIKDIKVWWLSILGFCVISCISYAIYFPTLTATLGYNTTISLVLCAPPFLLAVIIGFCFAIHSDANRERCFHFVTLMGICSIGFIIALSTRNIAARYVSFFFMAQGLTAVIILIAWVSNTFPKPAAKRAVALAFINSWAQVGGVAAPYAWPKKWGPSYNNSFIICLCMGGCVIVMSLLLRQYLKRLNEKLDKDGRKIEERKCRYVL